MIMSRMVLQTITIDQKNLQKQIEIIMWTKLVKDHHSRKQLIIDGREARNCISISEPSTLPVRYYLMINHNLDPSLELAQNLKWSLKQWSVISHSNLMVIKHLIREYMISLVKYLDTCLVLTLLRLRGVSRMKMHLQHSS